MTNEENFMNSRKNILCVLTKAYNNNMFYKKLLDNNGVNLGEDFDYKEFCKIPIMTKDDFRKKQVEIYKVLDSKKTFCTNSSGSTGRPVEVKRSFEDNIRMNFILNKYRNIISPGIMKEKVIMFHYEYRKKVNYDVDDVDFVFVYDKEYGGENCYRFAYFFLNDEVLKSCVEYINNEKPSWILGMSSFIYELAKYICKNGGLKHQLKYIECNSEYLFDENAIVIKKAFGINPTSMYGANEVNSIAIKCENGKMHILNESVFIEVEEGTKNVIATSLVDFHTPCIRYRIGDIAEISDNSCTCKMKGSVISLSGFRANDYFVIGDNKRIEMWHFHEIFRSMFLNEKIEIQQYNVTQYKNGIEFNLVVDQNNLKHKGRIIEFLNSEMLELFKEKVKVNVNFVDRIAPDEKTGKVKFFKSQLDVEMK